MVRRIRHTRGRMATVARLYRYPIKGLSATPLTEIDLAAGQGVAFDRAFALAHGSTQFDPLKPQYLPPASFFQLKRDERLAMLQASFDPSSGTLTLARDGRQVARGVITSPSGRMVIEQFFGAFLKNLTRGQPRLVHAPGHHFADAPEPFVSLINLASVKDLERVVGKPVDPLRFRGNLYIDGLPAWAEFDWVGRGVAVGAAQLEVATRIERCAATNVDPASGNRDLNLPQALRRAYGHTDMGVYARVASGGRIAVGDLLT
jgi:uncharacterized protein